MPAVCTVFVEDSQKPDWAGLDTPAANGGYDLTPPLHTPQIAPIYQTLPLQIPHLGFQTQLTIPRHPPGNLPELNPAPPPLKPHPACSFSQFKHPDSDPPRIAKSKSTAALSNPPLNAANGASEPARIFPPILHDMRFQKF